MKTSQARLTTTVRIAGALLIALAACIAGGFSVMGILIGHEMEALKLAAFAIVPAGLGLAMLHPHRRH